MIDLLGCFAEIWRANSALVCSKISYGWLETGSESIYLGFKSREMQMRWTLKSELSSECVKPEVILDGCDEIPPKWSIDPRESVHKSVTAEPASAEHPSDSQCVCVTLLRRVSFHARGGSGSSSWVKRQIMEWGMLGEGCSQPMGLNQIHRPLSCGSFFLT